MSIRRAMFAGSWYPENAKACEKEIQGFLQDQLSLAASGTDFNGGIVPHAGWYFSGSIACNVIHSFTGGKSPDAFIVFGTHLHDTAPRYIMTSGAWETPFGAISVQQDLAGEMIERFSFQVETPGDYSGDNTIELQLPFLKYFFKDAKIVPVGVPPTRSSIELGETTAKIAQSMGLDVRFIGSTDLTHYGHNYGFAPKGVGPEAVDWVRNENDRRVIDAMLSLNPEGVIDEAVSRQNACCGGAAAAAIAGAKSRGADHSQLVAYSTSYDKSPGSNLVGYVGILF